MRKLIAILGAVVCSASAVAQEKPTPGSVDPTFALIQRALEEFGPTSGIFRGTTFTRTDGVAGSLRFSRALTSKEIAQLKIAGVEFQTNADETPRSVGHVYPTFVRWESLAALQTFPSFVRAEAAWNPVPQRPLEATGPLIGSSQSHTRPPTTFTGSGVVIADIDSGIDVMHPHFFFADGGAYPWIDADGSGGFSEGDGVDLDQNGEVGRTEVLGFIEGAAVGYAGTLNVDDGFQPRVDWLFADLNEDGVRNLGIDDGFTEEDPGFGEPLFVVDDVNNNGTLDPNEPLIMLGTSKIRRLITADREYVRGIDLLQSSLDLEMLDLARHGTAVASIAVGGQAPHHTRVGIAPGAEFVAYTEGPIQTFEQTGQLGFINDAASNGVDVLLHEWTNAFTAPHDGSGNIEAAMDAAKIAGLLHVNPVGNLNISEKHTAVVSTNAMVTFEFNVGDGFDNGEEVLPYANVYGALFWVGDAPMFSLRSPSGTTVPLILNGPAQMIDDALVMTEFETTLRGNQHLVLYLWTDNQPTLASGTWSIVADNVTLGTEFFARIADAHSSWLRGVHWTAPVRDASTVVYPATADSAFGIGAYGGRNDDDTWDMSTVGQLRNYTGRGPRMHDRAALIDLIAPDDPFAAVPGSRAFLDVGYGRSWFLTFGGTSGAGPHVAGAMALLLEQTPNATPDVIEAALRTSANTTTFDPDFGAVPNPHWGHGRLDVYRALFGESYPQTNERPIAALELRGDVLDASQSSDPNGDALTFRFDSENDGVFETDWQTDPTYTAMTIGAFIRVDVRDSFGARSGAISLGVSESSNGDMGMDRGDTDLSTPRKKPKCECTTRGVQTSPYLGALLFALVFVRRRLTR